MSLHQVFYKYVDGTFTPNILPGGQLAAGGYLDFPSWIVSSQSWDDVILNNIHLPGIVSIEGVALDNSMKDNKRPGEAQGGVIVTGLIPPKFTIHGIILTGTDETAFAPTLAILMTLANPNQQTSLPIYHPMLAYANITACAIEKIKYNKPTAGGELTYDISCVTVAPGQPKATKVLSKGRGSKPKTNSTIKKTPSPAPSPPSKIANDWGSVGFITGGTF